ncbi:hypothetical protein CIK72_10855 [Brachybacterium alimentarium]|nr:hypothetical protein CIK72_10855 [Brachybacterium alimentarium]
MGIVEVLEISGGRSPLIIEDLDVYPQLPRITGAPTLNSEEPVNAEDRTIGEAVEIELPYAGTHSHDISAPSRA